MKDFSAHINRYAKIGIALSAEKNIGKLLEMIVQEAMALSNADAGTLYLMNEDKTRLKFEILQNLSVKEASGSLDEISSKLKDVILYETDGRPNHSNVSSYVALTGIPVNIPDVYTFEHFDFTGPRAYDQATGYRSQSMLVIPLTNHEDDITGVLQLLNAKCPDTGKIVSFDVDDERLVAALASQAAVALTNTQLISDLKRFFYAFIKSIATAIEQKSPFTGGHIKRVVDLTMMIADHVNKSEDGHFKDICFSEDELEALRIATWMHDVGKITTPEYIMNKETKLHTLSDAVKTIDTRFQLIKSIRESDYLKKRLEIASGPLPLSTSPMDIDTPFNMEVAMLDEEIQFIRSCNQPGEALSDEALERLHTIANKTYVVDGETFPYLTPEELAYLSIRKGSLTSDERKKIEHHVVMTNTILAPLPFPRKFARVPEFAGGHHEKMDGSGYPRGLKGDELPIQSRIMAVADIFESLTAKDRPYRKPISLKKAMDIMENMKTSNHIDSDIFDLMVKEKLYLVYGLTALQPEQIDME